MTLRLDPVVIACTNQATVDLGAPIEALTAALQKCYDTYFLPAWGYPVRLYVTDKPALTDWRFVYLDDADVAKALGYHDLTTEGQPISKVFAKTTIADGQAVSSVACHELFEMVLDPLANIWAQDDKGVLWAYEACDAVEDDTFLVDGLKMSNFILPAYFEVFNHPPGTKFDFLGKLTAPFTLDKGGYSIVMQNGKVRNIYGSTAKQRRFRREDRRLHRSEYRRG
jgi:hypothetical protein